MTDSSKVIISQLRRYLKRYKVVRQAAQLGRRVPLWRVVVPHYVDKLGFARGLRAMSATTFSRRDVFVKVPEIDRSIRIRPRTSDKYVFEQVFLQDEYHVQLGREPRFIVDAGANVGYASIYFANQYPLARILAIEPEERNFLALSENVKRYPNITPFQAALWSAPGELAVHDDQEAWSCTVGPISGQGHPKVASITLDEILKRSGEDAIDLLKIDIEGSEREVFSAPERGWLDKTKLLMIELHDRRVPGCTSAVECALKDYVVVRSQSGENAIFRFVSRA